MTNASGLDESFDSNVSKVNVESHSNSMESNDGCSDMGPALGAGSAGDGGAQEVMQSAEVKSYLAKVVEDMDNVRKKVSILESLDVPAIVKECVVADCLPSFARAVDEKYQSQDEKLDKCFDFIQAVADQMKILAQHLKLEREVLHRQDDGSKNHKQVKKKR